MGAVLQPPPPISRGVFIDELPQKPPPNMSQKGLDNPSPTTSRMLPPFQTQSSHTRRAAVGRGAHLKRKQLYNQRQTIPQPFGNRDSGQKSLQMIYAALVALSSTLRFDSPLCLQSRGTANAHPCFALKVNVKSCSVGVVCILGESVFRLGVQGGHAFGVWSQCPCRWKGVNWEGWTCSCGVVK